MMDEQKIIKYLKSLTHFDPDKSWLRASKEELIDFMKHTSPRRNSVFAPFAFLHNMKFAAGALILVLFLGSGAGAAFASQESLPGDTLFPVKLFTEEVEKFLARSNETKVELSIKFADRRIKEVIQLTANTENQGDENQEEIKNNIERFKLEIERGEGFLAKLDIKHKKKQDILKLVLKFEGDLAKHQEILEDLEDVVPEQAKEAIRRAREASARGEIVSFKLVLKIESESEEGDEEEDENGEEDENQRGEERNIQGSIGAAQGKIGAAANKIDATERRINREKERRGEEFTSAAQTKLDEAKTLLEEARSDFEDEEFLSAFEKAQQVIRLSQDAKRLIKEEPSEEETDEEEGDEDEQGGEGEEEDEGDTGEGDTGEGDTGEGEGEGEETTT